MASLKHNELQFRRQFVLGPQPLEEFAHWHTSFVGAHLVLQVHPDLPLTRIEHDGLRLTLLGYVLDPLAPENDDETILRELAERTPNANQVPRCAAELSGRWVLIADDGTDLILCHDPCGLREVYHTSWDHPETWVASQPDRIARPLGLTPGATQQDYFASPYYRVNEEAWMPGTASPYDQIRHLTPNHCLDLRTRKVRRYWPSKPLKEVSLEEGAHLSAQLLRENLRAAARRFPLALSLTAGMDSRTILAAARGIEDLWVYSGMWGGLNRGSADISVPRRVLRRLGLKHHVIECPLRASDEFNALYLENALGARDSTAAIAAGLLAGFPPERVQVNGHCSEIARDTFGITHRPGVTVDALAGLMNMRGTPFCLDQIDLWLQQARPVAERTGYRLWDLFFMEQEYGRWAANGQSQWDLVHERFTPFNHRGLLSTLLGIEPGFRQGPGYASYVRMMELLWPDVLREPFNQSKPSLSANSQELYRKVREHGVRGTLSKGVRKLLLH